MAMFNFATCYFILVSLSFSQLANNNPCYKKSFSEPKEIDSDCKIFIIQSRGYTWHELTSVFENIRDLIKRDKIGHSDDANSPYSPFQISIGCYSEFSFPNIDNCLPCEQCDIKHQEELCILFCRINAGSSHLIQNNSMLNKSQHDSESQLQNNLQNNYHQNYISESIAKSTPLSNVNYSQNNSLLNKSKHDSESQLQSNSQINYHQNYISESKAKSTILSNVNSNSELLCKIVIILIILVILILFGILLLCIYYLRKLNRSLEDNLKNIRNTVNYQLQEIREKLNRCGTLYGLELSILY